MSQTLMSVDDVMNFGKLSKSDPLLQMLLSSVFAAAEEYCNRKFSADSFTEYFDGDGQTTIRVANPPLAALSSMAVDVQYTARSIDTSSDVLGINEYWRRGELRLYNNEGTYQGGLAGVAVTYTGGYTRTTFPAELKEAICMEVLFRYNSREVGLAGQQGDGVTATYKVRGGFAADVADVLDRYRLWWKEFG